MAFGEDFELLGCGIEDNVIGVTVLLLNSIIGVTVFLSGVAKTA